MIALLLALAVAQTPQHQLFRQPNLPHSTGAFFEFAPASGAGMTAPCACTSPTGAKGETLTFTRASSATCTKTATGALATSGIANGDLVTCATNQPRVAYDSAGVLGLHVESTRTNSLLRSAELETGSWVPLGFGGPAPPTVTANYATGPGGTSSAERIQVNTCAGASSGSVVYQNYTGTAAAWTGTVYLKGTSGSGNVNLYYFDSTAGAGTAVNCAYVSTSWTRCALTRTYANTTHRLGIGCLNEAVITGSTNTGAADVLVWGAQSEAGAYATSYIPTTSAAVTRSADDAKFIFSPTLGNFSFAGNAWTPSTLPVMRLHGALLREPDDGVNFVASYQDTPLFRGQFGSTAGTTSFLDGTPTTTSRAASYFDGTLLGACIASSCTTQAKGSFSIANFTNPLAIRIGAYSTINGNIDGVASRLCFEPNDPSRCR